MTTAAFVNAGTFSHSTTGVTSFVPPLPGGITPGNVLLAWCQVASGTAPISVSVDWTLLDSFGISGFNGVFAWAWRLATGSDNAPTFSWTGSANVDGAVFQYLGTTATPIGAKLHNSNVSTTMSAGSITSTANSSLAIAIMVNGLGTNIPATPTNWLSDSTGNLVTTTLGSYNLVHEALGSSGSVSDAISGITISDTAWAIFVAELLQSGIVPPLGGSKRTIPYPLGDW